MSIVVVAEKPSVARDIGRVLGATKRADGYLEGGGYRVTWAIGHLVRLAEPHEIEPEWKKWRRESLPMLPEAWPVVAIEKTKDQYEVVRKLLTARDVEKVVCATDAGREGELIFRYIQEAAGCRKPVQRLWISSLTDQAIRDGFRSLQSAEKFDALADAARGRSYADWLVGMNLSRAYGLSLDDQLSVGRVQTPTLAMLVERELAIRSFVPEAYFEVRSTFALSPSTQYDGNWIAPDAKGEKAALAERKKIQTREQAERIAKRVELGSARIASVKQETRKTPPPPLYDLTELQRHANRLYGLTAERTLAIAQRLYETHKVLSYPRTDSRHLSQTVAQTLGPIVDAIRAPYEPHVADASGTRPLGKRHVDDARVTDHHAIIPTGKTPGALSEEERKVYDLVCRRLLQAWHSDLVEARTTVFTEVESDALVDVFHSSGTTVEDPGWKVLDVGGGKKSARKKTDEDEDDAVLPPGLRQGQLPQVVRAQTLEKKTRPPPRLSDASLLTAMETAGRTLDEKELSDAMKESGLGTPATRANMIETLIDRGYVVRSGKTLEPTDKGVRLVEVVDETVKSPLLTGRWEARLQAIEQRKESLPAFLRDVERYVTDVVGRVPVVHPARGLSAPASSVRADAEVASPIAPVMQRRPNESLDELLARVFGFGAFRPHQKEVCEAATRGDDVLLVMPTGAGKSLCYQLPGLARGGTTLVVSPLIALIEDQVGKLQALGLNAARIHSGLDRQTSRQVCRDYLDGRLDYLFIAPERLGVPGFPEMLAKRTPALVAIDEAHCISQWGHDFRPDYRLLGQRLPLLRPAPIVAVTATATPIVQEDIQAQLGLGRARTFIHGFRRTNLAIEVLESTPGERNDLSREILERPGALPAILYAPTRKKAAEAAEALSSFGAAAYHAGMTAEARERVQSAFLTGRLNVVVATVAFGMGVDKADVRTVIHLALPQSVEGYYQEIGRAGRDGKLSRAILLHSWADRRMHEFFHERDYPEPADVERVFESLSARAITKETLRRKAGLSTEVLEKALEKLWMSGAVHITPDETVSKGADGWQQAYRAQRELRGNQSVLMGRYTETHACRMLHLIRHFGDTEDSGKPCGLCDVCAPANAVAARGEPPGAEELRALQKTMEALRTLDRQSAGRLAKQVVGESAAHRRAFDRILGGLTRARLVTLVDDEFETEGRRISFQRVCLTNEGRGFPLERLREVLLARIASVAKGAKGRKRPAATAAKKGGAKKAGKAPVTLDDSPLVKALREYRLGEARRRRVPAFRIFTDRVLAELANVRPVDAATLAEVSGVGPKFVAEYGAGILAICRAHD